MERVSVESSMLEAVGYDNDTQELEVVFKSGQTYRYKGVPRSIYDGLLAADSKGSYIHAHVLGAFPDELIARRK